MKSYTQQKIEIKDTIMEAVNKHGSIEKDKTVAEICLKTGIGIKTVDKIIQQLDLMNYVKVDGNAISKIETDQ